MPTPSAAFSPLRTQRAASSSLAQPRQQLLDGLAAGPADDVGDEEDLQLVWLSRG